MAYRKKKKAKKKITISNLIFVFALIYLLFNIYKTQLTISQKQSELNNLEQSYNQKEVRLDEAKRTNEVPIEKYMEDYARNNMNYIYPNDRIFYVIN